MSSSDGTARNTELSSMATIESDTVSSEMIAIGTAVLHRAAHGARRPGSRG